MARSLSSQAENSTDSVVDCADESSWQLACSVDEPPTVDQLQPERHGDGVLGNPVTVDSSKTLPASPT